MKTIECIDAVVKHAEQQKGEPKVVRKVKVGQVAARQGDIYLHVVPEDHPRGEELDNHQLAPGSSRGSRHVADERCEVYAGKELPKCFKRDRALFGRVALGPLLVLNGDADITHPEHGDIQMRAGRVCLQVTYQVDERTKERVRD